jgi:hypothetical protein
VVGTGGGESGESRRIAVCHLVLLEKRSTSVHARSLSTGRMRRFVIAAES